MQGMINTTDIFDSSSVNLLNNSSTDIFCIHAFSLFSFFHKYYASLKPFNAAGG